MQKYYLASIQFLTKEVYHYNFLVEWEEVLWYLSNEFIIEFYKYFVGSYGATIWNSFNGIF